jgi:hypothetical protein
MRAERALENSAPIPHNSQEEIQVDSDEMNARMRAKKVERLGALLIGER